MLIREQVLTVVVCSVAEQWEPRGEALRCRTAIGFPARAGDEQTATGQTCDSVRVACPAKAAVYCSGVFRRQAMEFHMGVHQVLMSTYEI